jgi:DMSO/TMAO reductase YedYZ molybdopterin-dependent catalytic subunit
MLATATPPPDTLSPDMGEIVVAEGESAEAMMQQMTRRSLLWTGLATLGTIGGIAAFQANAPEDGTGIKTLFRKTHEFNEQVARTVFFSEKNRDKEFPRQRAVKPRPNYKGAAPQMAPEAWRLHLEGTPEGTQILTLADLKTLPEVSQTTELKCVEGWSAIVHWTGVRFKDFAETFPPPPGTTFVAMRSEPEGFESEWYYVGLDWESCVHPQTLLAYAMNDAELPVEHGFPLRLVMPHKYGIKNIKLITHIAYSTEQPRDYWAERGYDWYAGL